MQRVEFKNKEITVVGHLYTPADFDEQKQYPAIVLCHPAGGVKEQTTGTYAAEMAKQGYVTLAYDSSYQGESSGMPREMEIPEIRIADISAGVDFLTTLPYVDNDRIGGLGICAGGGYMAAAAMRDPRIKTVGTVSAVNLGDGLRYGWGGHETPQSLHLDEILKQAAAARTARMNGAEPTYIPLVPKDLTGVTLPDMIEAHEYYWTPRAHHERAVSRMLIDTLLEQSTLRCLPPGGEPLEAAPDGGGRHSSQHPVVLRGPVSPRWLGRQDLAPGARGNPHCHVRQVCARGS